MTGDGPPRPGDILVLADEDYRYGMGPLIARIESVVGRVEYHGEPWWSVHAEVAAGAPDNHGGWQHRDLYVREATLITTRQARDRTA